jgi:hypothetical protein
MPFTVNSGITAPTSSNIIEAFTVFPNFPLELRREIWRFTINPRIVEVRFVWRTNCLEHDFVADIPVVPHVCHEAREEGLRFYTSDLHTKHNQNRVHFNYALDTLYFRDVRDPPEDPPVRPTHYQPLAFVDTLPHKDKIRRIMTTNVRAIAIKFPALEEVGMIQRVHVNNDGNCEAYNFNVIKNQNYFFNENEEIHVCHHLETSAKGCYVTAGGFSKTWIEFMEGVEGWAVLYTGEMARAHPELQWKEPLVTIQSIVVGHITEEETYCQASIEDLDDDTDSDSGENSSA